MRFLTTMITLCLSMSIICIPTLTAFALTNQERWAYEYVQGIPGVQSPFFGKNIDLPISSSWNEPRTSEIHKGIDQAASGGTNIGPMYETARVLVNQNIPGGGNTQVIRYYNLDTKKTFYSVYMHLSAFVKTNNTVVYPSDVTAKTGNSGLNCGNGCYHLHYELLDSIPVTSTSAYPYFNVDYSKRIGVNPFTYMTPVSAEISEFTWNSLAVFKKPQVNGRRLTIQARNTSSDGNNELTQVKIYFKANNSSSYSVANMSKNGTSTWFYDFANTFSSVDYFVIGRRNSSERWVTYPVKNLNLGTDASGIVPSPNQSTVQFDTLRINFR